MSDQLTALLLEAQRLGFVGAAPIESHIAHARGFAIVVGSADAPERVVDLGSGGGVPSLVVAEVWSTAQFWLVESGRRRAEFLDDAVVQLGWRDRVEVCHDRAEQVARRGDLRASMDVALARGFGPPAVTAECAAPFLRVGGHLVVSEPPTEAPLPVSRWSTSGLAEVGLVQAEPDAATEANYAVFDQTLLSSDRYPRRTGVPAKRPLF